MRLSARRSRTSSRRTGPGSPCPCHLRSRRTTNVGALKQKGLVFSRSTKGGEYALQSQRDLRRGSFPSCRNDSFSGGAMAVETSYTTFPLKWIGIWRVPHEPWFDAVVCREIGNELRDGLARATPEGAALARVLHSPQDSKRRERNPLARLAGRFQREPLVLLQIGDGTRAGHHVRVHRVQQPAPVRPALVLEDLEGRPEPSVARESELGDHIEPDEDVVEVVIRIVEPEPRGVPSPLLEQPPFQVELGSSRDRLLDLPGPLRPG